MKLSQQQIQALAGKIATKTKETKFNNPLVIGEILTMLSEQRSCYSEFEFLGKSGFILVLKAKNGSRHVALKIEEFDQSKQKAIEAIKWEYVVSKSLQTNEKIVKLNDSFFLTQEQEQYDEGPIEVDNEEEEEKTSKELISVTTVNRYFVQEKELCQDNLVEYFGELRKKEIILKERVKQKMVVQMLGALNFLHQKNIAHRDIKPQNFLFQEKEGLTILTLCDFGFASPKNFLTGMRTSRYIAPEVEQGQSRKESDNYALGIIILEINKFDYSKVSIAEHVNLQQVQGIFPKHNLNTSPALFQMSYQTLLQPFYQDISSTQNIFLLLLKQQHNSLKTTTIYSINPGNQLSPLPFTIPQLENNNTQQQQKQKSISTSLCPSEETSIKIIDLLVEAYWNSQNNNSLTKKQAKDVLRALFKQGEYDNLELLGTGTAGLVIGGLNKKQQRQTALKICLCTNKSEIFRQIDILKKCQMPRIVQLYGYQFVQDENDHEYVVFEMKRCLCSLTDYLKEQCQNNKPYSPELKMKLSIQMIDSVNYLHELEILHRDIKLDNFLISEDKKGGIVVKLTDFDQAAQLEKNYCWKWNNKNHDDELLPPYNCAIILEKQGTLPYNAPERKILLNPTTTKTVAYSLGLCLLVLDNYLTFSEDTFISKQHILDEPYSEPFLEHQEVIIDRNSEIYKIANKLLAYLPKNRSTLQKILQDSQSIEQVYSKQKEFSFSLMSMKQVCYFKYDKTQKKINFELIIKQISNLTNLTRLSLDLGENSINQSGVNYLSTELGKLIHLSSLSLDLSTNSIKESGVNYLSTELSKLINLSSLSLELRYNSIGDSGVNYLSAALIKLINLLSLSLGLRHNSIGESGINYISTKLSKLINLSSLSLDLRYNLFRESGVNHLSTALIKLINLSSLYLDLSTNSIGDQDVNFLSNALNKLINLSSLSLNLKFNQIGKSGENYLFTELSKLINLKSLSLDLCCNPIGKSGAKYLSNALIKLINLSSLSLGLGGNSIEKSNVNYLFIELSKLINLSSLSLDLNTNSIEDSGTNYLSTQLSKLINLQSLSLDLNTNSIGESGTNDLFTQLSKLINLSSLSVGLSSNQIGKSGVNYFFTELSKLIYLESLSLNLSSNQIGESGAKYLSDTLIKLINLSSLSLNLICNSIGDAGVKCFSNALSKLINLSHLSLDLNTNSIEESGVNYFSTELIKLSNLSSYNNNLVEISGTKQPKFHLLIICLSSS